MRDLIHLGENSRGTTLCCRIFEHDDTSKAEELILYFQAHNVNFNYLLMTKPVFLPRPNFEKKIQPSYRFVSIINDQQTFWVEILITLDRVNSAISKFRKFLN